MLGQEAGHQRRDVLDAVPQRRDHQPHHAEAVEEILSERPLLRERRQIAVAGRDDPGIDLHALVAPHRHDDLRFDGPEQLGLERQRQLADLVQEERAPVGRSEESLPPLLGAGEGAPLVAEEGALHQVLGDGAHVDRHEGPVTPVGQIMNRPRDDFLAGTALTGDEHVADALGDLPDHRLELLHRSTLEAQEGSWLPFIAKHAAEAGVFATQGPIFGDSVDLRPQRRERDRLEEIVMGASAERLDGGAQRGVGSHDQDHRVRAHGASVVQHREPVPLRESEVGEHHIEGAVAEELDGLLRGPDRADRVFELRQVALYVRAKRRLVFDHEDPLTHDRLPSGG